MTANPRTPDQILEDFETGCQGAMANMDMRAILWEVIDDIRQSYRLAMEAEDVDEGTVDAVQDTVLDYAVNHYGDD